MTTISALPPAPQPTDDTSTFNAKAFALLAALAGFVTEANAQAGENNTAASTATTGAGTATTKAAEAAATLLSCIANAQAAAASAGAIAWVSGTTYAVGDVRWSPVDNRVYRRRVAGAGTTDPSADSTNWGLVSSNGLQLVVVTGTTQTAASGGRYVLTNAAQSTLTAPPSPQAGDRFAVKVANGRFDNLVNWNGSKHESLSDTTMTLNGAFLSLEFIFINSTIGWVIV